MAVLAFARSVVWTGLLAVLLCACACARRASTAGSRRLPAVRVDEQIDLLDRLADAQSEPGSGAVRWLFPVLRDEQREALVVVPPGRLHFRNLPLYAGATLSFGYSIVVPPRQAASPLRLRVEAVVGGKVEELFSTVTEPQSEVRDGWQDVEVPLPSPDRPGAPFELVLAVESLGAGAAVMAWSSPTIRSTGAPGRDDRDVVPAETGRVDLFRQFDGAMLLASAAGRRPRRRDIELPHNVGTLSLIEVPPQTGLRFRLDVSPDDAVRVRFQAGPEAGRERSGIGGAIRVLLRVRDAAAGGAAGAGWRDVGEMSVGVTAIAPWRRVEQATFPLGFVAAGVADVELRTEGVGLQGSVVAGLQDLELVSQTRVRRRAATDGGKNVIVLLVDALRADHLGLYGYGRDTSPNLDREAARGLVFDRMFTTATWTRPAVMSLFTGTWPTTHGAVLMTEALHSPERRVLGDVLREAGYSTVAFSGNPLIGETHGFRAGFEDFEECYMLDAGRINERLLRWLRAHRAERFFAYVHYMEPHAPYGAPGAFYDFFDPQYAGRFDHDIWRAFGDPTATIMARALVEGTPITPRDDLGEDAVFDAAAGRASAGPPLLRHLTDLYDGEIRSWDSEFGKLLAALAAEGLDERTIVVVLADHGEAFGEHGHLGHAYDCFEETLRIPLVLLDPDEARPRRIAGTTSLADVAPILLDRLGLPEEEGFEGWPLSRIEGPDGTTRSVPAQTSYYVPTSPAQRPQRTPAFCVRGPDLKVVYVPRDEVWEAWRPESDPTETRRVAPDDPAVQAHQAELREQRATLEALVPELLHPSRPVRSIEEEALQVLGYIR